MRELKSIKIVTGYENGRRPGHDAFRDMLRFLIEKALVEETDPPERKKERAVARRRERTSKAIAFQKYYGKKCRPRLKGTDSNSLAYRNLMRIIRKAKHR